MARNKKVEILSNDKEVLHPMTDGDCVIFEDGQTLAQKLSEDDSVKYTPEIVNSSPMFKVGEGNTVDYSDNVLDGAYERATLQGQTYVNYIQESSADEVTLPTPFTEYERTQHNTLTSDEEGVLGINLVGQSYVNALQHDSEEEFVVLGESLEFQEKKVEYTNEGQIKSAMLKGQTLVNIFKSFANYTYSERELGVKWLIGGAAPLTETLNNDELTMTIIGVGSKVVRMDNISMLKPNTKYMVKINYTTSFENQINFGYFNNSLIYTQIASMKSNEYAIFTTPSDLSTWVGLWFGILSDLQVGDVMKISKPVLFEYQEGMENWDIPYFEGMQSVTVSTRLENKLGTCTVGSIVQYAKNGKTLTTTDASARQCVLYSTAQGATNPANLKPNTEYIIGFKISNLVLDGLSSIDLTFSSGTVESSNCLFTSVTGGDSKATITSNGTYRLRRKTTDLITSSMAVIKGFTDQWENSGSTLRSLTISNIMYVEYQNGMENWDLPYFEDYQVMKPVQVESVNKNIVDFYDYTETRYGITNTIKDGIFTITGTSTRSGGRNNFYGYSTILKAGKTYVFSVHDLVETGAKIPGFYITNSKTGMALYAIGMHENGVKVTSQKITVQEDTLVHIWNNTLEGETYNTTCKLMLEESDTATEYVPHQSKTTYSWDEVILRKVGDVEDTLDLTTGEWVQRIGEIDFHDYSYVQINADRSNDTYTNITRPILDAKKGSPTYPEILCNKFSTVGHESYIAQPNIVYMDWGYINITVPNSSLGDTITDNGCLKWLRDNNIKIIYPLETPIVHKVNLSRPNLQVYNDITHVHTKCLDGTLIPNIYLPSDISYPAILEPSTTYNVCVNHTKVSTDNPLKVNVGGTEITMTDSRMTLTTPATLANSNVSFTGKGNKIKESMLIKNSSLLTRDLPHFNGIGSVQLGKTIENLCSGRYIKGGSAQATLTDALDTVKITTTTQGSYVLEFPILTPLENGKTYFVYAPVSGGGWATYSFVRTYNNSKSYLRQPMGEMMNPQQYIVTIDQSDNQYVSLCIGCHGAISVGTTYTITRPILCEYEPGMEDWDWESIGYFTGTKNIGNEFMRIGNKNLFDGKIELGGYTGTTGEPYNANDRIRSINKIYLKPGVYYLSSDNATAVAFGIFNIDGTFRQEHADTSGNRLKLVLEQEAYAHITVINPDLLNAKIQLEEASSATSYVAHKHNSLYILPNKQIPLTFEQGAIMFSNTTSFAEQTNNAMTTRIRTGLLDLEPNETYRISFGDKNYICGIAFYDNSNIGLDAVSEISNDYVFTTTKDVHKMCINIAKSDMNANITPSVLHQVRLEKITDVTLRSVGDVHDELDITRGIYTQRIGEITINGENNFYIAYHPSNNPVDGELSPYGRIHYTTPNADGGWSDEYFMSSQVISHCSGAYYANETNCIGIDRNGYTYISLDHNLFGDTREGVLEYLKQHPITYSYRLKTPIIHKVHIGNKNEANTEVTKPNDVFTLPTLYTEQTHIDLTNNGIMPKVQSRDYIAYPVLPMISRTYTLQHNLTGGVSNLTVDLLGRTQSVSYQNHKSLIYSPETMDAILHNELRISGKGKISGVMYIDGGYMDRDIPYIEGMKNAVNPIVKNIGKNLFDGVVKNGEAWWDGKIGFLTRCRRSVNLTPVKPNTEYIFKLTNRYGIGCGANFMAHGKDGKFLKYIGWVLSDTSKFTTPSDCYYIHWYNDIDDFTDFYIEESSTPSQYEPYKENICYVDCGEIRLTPDMFEQGNFGADSTKTYEENKNNGANRYRTKSLIKVEPNTTYKIRHTEYYSAVYEYGKDEKKLTLGYNINKSTLTITTSNNCYYLAFSFVTSTLPTQYVSITKVSEIKQLRSLPNGVHDEIDLETGKYVQRVGEIVFNGDTKFDDWGERGENGLTFNYYDTQVKQLENEKVSVFADTLLGTNLTTTWSGTPYTVAQADNGNYLQICLNKNDLRENTRDGINDYFLQNPVTVQYELAEPIVKDIVIHNYPHSYEGGHVIIENGDPNTPIPAQLTYRAVTNRSGQIQQHTEQVEKQEREINELETLILANIHLSQTR